MSLFIVAFTMGFFLLLMLGVYMKGREKKPSRDERISMRQDEDMEFFNETDTEGQEDDPGK